MAIERRVAEWRGQPLSECPGGLTWLANYVAPRPWLIFAATSFPLLCLLSWLEGLVLHSIGDAKTVVDLVVFLLTGGLSLSITTWISRYVRPKATQIPRRDHSDSMPRLDVRISFEVDGHIYGEDRGELTLVEDWLIFEGERTSFSLSPQDVTERRRRADELTRRECVVMIRNTGAGVSLKIVSEEVNRDPMDFLYSWMNSEVEYPGVSVLPPLQPMPGLRRGRFSKFSKVPLRVIVFSLTPILLYSSAMQGFVGLTIFWTCVLFAFLAYIFNSQMQRGRSFHTWLTTTPTSRWLAST